MSLDNSECEMSGEGVPLYRPLAGLEPLHRHQEEAASQSHAAPGQWADQARQTWDLMAALWGNIEEQVAIRAVKKILVPRGHWKLNTMIRIWILPRVV